jgi:hypothetical protein
LHIIPTTAEMAIVHYSATVYIKTVSAAVEKYVSFVTVSSSVSYVTTKCIFKKRIIYKNNDETLFM